MLENFNNIFENGHKLPLIEEFYTLQGEGTFTGQAAYFIRLGGCDIACYWCDSKHSWNIENSPLVLTDEIVNRASKYPAKAVVVTGGEPSLYPLAYLTKKLHEIHIKTFVETSGAYLLTGEWDWICLSPKNTLSPRKEILRKTNELKIIVMNDKDFLWAEKNAELVSSKCKLYLQPEWSVRNMIIPIIVEYVMNNPKWKISLQTHKYLNIP